MKVYQLMNLLEKAPAGMDVVVGLAHTLNAEVVGHEQDEVFILTGGDAELIDDDGNSKGYLSQWAEPEEASDD